MIDLQKQSDQKPDHPRMTFQAAEAWVRANVPDAGDFDCLVSYVLPCRRDDGGADARRSIESLRRNCARLFAQPESARPSNRDLRRAKRKPKYCVT
jgi:hypothetical protein